MVPSSLLLAIALLLIFACMLLYSSFNPFAELSIVKHYTDNVSAWNFFLSVPSRGRKLEERPSIAVLRNYSYKVFLDPGTVQYNPLLLCRVASHVLETLKNKYNSTDVLFLVSKSFLKKNHLNNVWGQYMANQMLPNSPVQAVPLGDLYQPIVRRNGSCHSEASSTLNLSCNLRVTIVSAVDDKDFKKRCASFANDSRHMFVLFRRTPTPPLSQWNNLFHISYDAPSPELLFPTLNLTRSFDVFLDHGGVDYHAEVFFDVASLVLQKQQEENPGRNITFIVSNTFAEKSGLKRFWQKYVTMESLAGAQVQWQPLDHFYQPILRYKRCFKDNATAHAIHYDLRVIVTSVVHADANFSKCCAIYANNSRYMFIIHRPHEGDQRAAALSWNNSFVASQAEANRRAIEKERLFTPHRMPLSPSPPDCSQRPVAVVQGGMNRRELIELEWLLRHTPKWNVTIRVLTKRELSNKITKDGRIDFRRSLDMTEFHEAFLGASFILPLIMPGKGQSSEYLQGHPTSTIAYSLHFGLRVIAHEVVFDAYRYDLQGQIIYLHEGNEVSFSFAMRRALEGFQSWCSSDSPRTSWAVTP